MNRRKIQVDMQEKQYKRHLHKLELIQEDKKTTRSKILKKRQLVDELMHKSHKLHAKSLKYRNYSLNKQSSSEIFTKYSRVKSVVLSSIRKQLPSIPIKQKNKQSQFYIQKQNTCLFNRLITAKPSIQFGKQNRQSVEKILNIKQRIFNTDFLSILNNSILGIIQKQKIIIKLRKKNNQECLIVNFNHQQMKKIMKSMDRSFNLYIQSDEHKIKTQIMDLENILSRQFHIFKQKADYIQIKFNQIYNEKQIYKGHIQIPPFQSEMKKLQTVEFKIGTKKICEIRIQIHCHKVVKKIRKIIKIGQ